MSAPKPVDPNIKPGFYAGIPNESYHAGPGISKSGLWTIHTLTPAHYKFGEREDKNHFDFGEGVHLAILEPNVFEKRVTRGPDDRRGNKWKDLAEACAAEGRLLLTSGDYDKVLAIRDSVHANETISGLIAGGKPMIEASAYWRDPQTNALCRCRPDLYREDIELMLDVKSARSAHPDAFARAVVNYGYHVQEAFYTDGLTALKKPVDAVAFLVWEKEPPYAFAIYELPPGIVDEGRAIARKALDTYADCVKAGQWPGYGEGVQELSFQRWAFRLTDPNVLDEELAA